LIWVLSNIEKALVIQNALTVLINSVPYDDTKTKTIEETQKFLWDKSNWLQPIECLGCHCMSEFALTNEIVLKNLTKSIELTTNKTMFDLLFLKDKNEKRLKEDFMKTFLYSDSANIQNDLCMRNLI
jgi:hypothetical protein